MALSLNFIIFFMGMSVAVLFGVMIFGEVSEVEAQQETCEDPNCIVNFNGADCLDCEAEESAIWVVIGGVPLVLAIVIFFLINGFENGFKVFGGLGGKKPTGGGGVPISLFFDQPEPRKEEGWLGIGDFKNGI